jgi:hypothetical protein
MGTLPRRVDAGEACPARSGPVARAATLLDTPLFGQLRACARARVMGFTPAELFPPPALSCRYPRTARPRLLSRARPSAVFGPESPPWNLQRRFRARRRPHGMDDFGEYVRRTSASTCDDGASDGRVRLRQFSRNWNKKIFTVFTPCPLPAPSGAEKINPRGSKR